MREPGLHLQSSCNIRFAKQARSAVARVIGLVASLGGPAAKGLLIDAGVLPALHSLLCASSASEETCCCVLDTVLALLDVPGVRALSTPRLQYLHSQTEIAMPGHQFACTQGIAQSVRLRLSATSDNRRQADLGPLQPGTTDFGSSCAGTKDQCVECQMCYLYQSVFGML